MAETSRQKGLHALLFVICDPSSALIVSQRPRIPASVVGIPASESIFSKICSDSDIYASRARDSAP